MKKFVHKLLNLFGIGDPNVYGPAVSGKAEGSNVSCYFPFSKGSESPVIATEQFAMPRTGTDIITPFHLNGATANNKLWISKVSKLRPDTAAPKTLGAESQHILLGGQEYGKGGYRGIGIGFSSYSDRAAPVFVGAQEVDSNESAKGDFIVATRDTVKPETPTVKFRVTTTGQICASAGYTPQAALDLATKQYVDDVITKLKQELSS